MPLSNTSDLPSAFRLSDPHSAKADPRLIGADDQHFAAVAAALETRVAAVRDRLAAAREVTARAGQAALDRDEEVRRLTAQLATLGRYRLDLCLGRMVPADGGEPIYVGRFGLADADGRRLLIDWRTPAAEPFFAATGADPHGLRSRRRYRWHQGRVIDYWDEAFATAADDGDTSLDDLALDDDSAFIASLAASRSHRMRDVLATLQADQNAIIRADSRGALVVDGGPGTGKTVVALHRAAYLLHADPRLGPGRGGVLIVGPHQPYLNYVADVLPSLGETSVQTCTLDHLVAEGGTAPPEQDVAVARLKERREMVEAIERAARIYEEPPSARLLVETEWGDVRVGAADWAEAFAALGGAPHNEARDGVWEQLLDLLTEQADPDEVSPAELRAALARDPELRTTFSRAWPLLDAEDLVGDLWSVPAYLRHCAPHLGPDEVRLLQRDDPHAWTAADLPLLDAARARLGDRDAGRRARLRDREAQQSRDRMTDVIDHIIAADASEGLMLMLVGDDLRDALVDLPVDAAVGPDLFAGPFAHVIVDEAQELTDAQWQMLRRRCPSGSFTVVGDRAQSRAGFAESWSDRLARVGLGEARLATLQINYRTPAEVMQVAAREIRAALPDANVPESIRSGAPVRHLDVDSAALALLAWLEAHEADTQPGVAAVISADGARDATGALPPSDRVVGLTPVDAKGLEFDLVVVVRPRSFGDDVTGAVDRYVAMTRATGELIVAD